MITNIMPPFYGSQCISDKQTKKFQVTDTDTGGVCEEKYSIKNRTIWQNPIVRYVVLWIFQKCNISGNFLENMS